MDNAATSFPKPEVVYHAVEHTLREIGGNPGRSGHRMALDANKIVFEAREAVAALFGVEDSSRIIFTSCATESLNTAIKGVLKPGGHVVTSCLEHSSVTRPLHAMRKRGVEITKVGCNSEGLIDPAEVRKALRDDTALIVMTHASNVVGTVEPVREIGAVSEEAGIPFLLDASQTAGSIPVDVTAMKVDMLAAPGHKGLLGPQGTGILYVGPKVMPAPLMEGGTGGGEPSDEQPETLPDRFEAGTMNTPGIAGLGAAVRFILEEGLDRIRKKESALVGRLLKGLSGIEGVKIYGPMDAGKRASLVSFNITGLDPSMVSYILDEDYGIMTRNGLHCAPDAHRFLGTFPAGCVRLSPGYFNTDREIDFVIEAVTKIAGRRKE